MHWDHIANEWAAMAQRLRNSGLHAPDITGGTQGLENDVRDGGSATAAAATAQAVVTVARSLART